MATDPRRKADELAAELGATQVPEDVAYQLRSLSAHGDVIDDAELWLRTAVAHRFKYMPIEKVHRCLCGSDDHRLISRFVFWNLLGLRECRACGVLFVSPRLTAEAMTQHFNEAYFDPDDMDTWGVSRQPVFEDIFRYFQRYECRHVFDVGAAYGHFLAFSQARGIKGSGCDVSRVAVARGRNHLGVDMHAGPIHDLIPRTDPFDAVVSLDALYYAPDPLAELRAMRSMVKPGGYVILRLRNGSLARRHARSEEVVEAGRSSLPAEHLWGFTPESIPALAEAGQFEIVLVEPAAYSRNILAPLQRLRVGLNRLGMRLKVLGIRTLSFNVVFRRPS